MAAQLDLFGADDPLDREPDFKEPADDGSFEAYKQSKQAEPVDTHDPHSFVNYEGPSVVQLPIGFNKIWFKGKKINVVGKTPEELAHDRYDIFAHLVKKKMVGNSEQADRFMRTYRVLNEFMPVLGCKDIECNDTAAFFLTRGGDDGVSIGEGYVRCPIHLDDLEAGTGVYRLKGDSILKYTGVERRRATDLIFEAAGFDDFSPEGLALKVDQIFSDLNDPSDV